MKWFELEQANAVMLAVAQHCAFSSKARATLRRSQGTTLGEARASLWFRQLLTQLRKSVLEGVKGGPSDELIFLVSTFLADDSKTLEYVKTHDALPTVLSNLGAALDNVEQLQDAEARDKKLSFKPDPSRRESRFERRLRLLLDAELTYDAQGELPFRLRQCVRLVHSLRDGHIRIAWGGLLHDLSRWNLDNGPTRREWAQAFYGDPRAKTQTQPDEQTEPATDLETDVPVQGA